MANQFEDLVKQWTDGWKKGFEDLQTQFSSGKMDAAEAFEKQKETLKAAAVQWKEQLDKAGDMAEEKSAELRKKIEELNTQLNLGKVSGMDVFEEQRKKIEAAIEEVKKAGKATYNDQFDSMMGVFNNSTNAFKTGLEVMQLQFSLGKMTVKEDVEKVKKEISEKMHEFGNAFEEAKEAGMKNLESWNKQMHDQYEKMKAWSEDWMKKMK